MEVQETENKRVSLRFKTPWHPVVAPCRGLDHATMNRPGWMGKTDPAKSSQASTRLAQGFPCPPAIRASAPLVLRPGPYGVTAGRRSAFCAR